MKLRLIWFVLIPIATYGQICEDFQTAEVKGEKVRSSPTLHVDFDRQEGVDLFLFRIKDSVGLMLTQTGQVNCTTPGNAIEILFTDSTVLKTVNQLPGNCDQRFAIYFSASVENTKGLQELTGRLVQRIFISAEKEHVYDVPEIVALDLQRQVRCLVDEEDV